jgi:hypothetical protein
MDGLCEESDEMRIKAVIMEMTNDKEWKKKTCCADTT